MKPLWNSRLGTFRLLARSNFSEVRRFSATFLVVSVKRSCFGESSAVPPNFGVSSQVFCEFRARVFLNFGLVVQIQIYDISGQIYINSVVSEQVFALCAKFGVYLDFHCISVTTPDFCKSSTLGFPARFRSSYG